MKLGDVYHRKIHLKIRMVALLMSGILNFTTIEEKNEFYKFELQKNVIKDKMTGRVDISLRKLQKS